jgi:hypothetical protein
MNLYRLDIIEPDGSSYPVTDLLGVRLIRQRKVADDVGSMTSLAKKRVVTLTRIYGAGATQNMGFWERGMFTRNRKDKQR